MNIEDIEKELKTPITPFRASELKSSLSAEYSYCCGVIESIVPLKASKWPEIRLNTKSDISATRAWEMTESGIIESQMKIRIKRLEKIISALSSIIKLAEGQMRHL